MVSQITFKQEMMRKLFHVTSIILPVLLYLLNDTSIFLMVIVPLTIIVVGVELSRGYVKIIDQLFIRFFGKIMREHELQKGGNALSRLTGTSYLLLAASICLYFFPIIVTVSAFLILTISDSCAAIIGRKWGKHRFLGKSLEGSLAFWVSAIVSVSILGIIDGQDRDYFIIALIASSIATIVEAVSGVMKIDDNFSIPISYSLAFTMLISFWGL